MLMFPEIGVPFASTFSADNPTGRSMSSTFRTCWTTRIALGCVPVETTAM
jgi:hypothetical protein